MLVTEQLIERRGLSPTVPPLHLASVSETFFFAFLFSFAHWVHLAFNNLQQIGAHLLRWLPMAPKTADCTVNIVCVWVCVCVVVVGMKAAGLKKLPKQQREGDENSKHCRESVTEKEVEREKRRKEKRAKQTVRNNREPITQGRMRGELRFSSLSRFDEEFLLPQMGSKVCLFFLKQFLTFSKPRTILAIVERSGVK